MAMTMTATRSRMEIESDIKETFGLVPTFFKRMPDKFLAPNGS